MKLCARRNGSQRGSGHAHPWPEGSSSVLGGPQEDALGSSHSGPWPPAPPGCEAATPVEWQSAVGFLGHHMGLNYSRDMKRPSLSLCKI